MINIFHHQAAVILSLPSYNVKIYEHKFLSPSLKLYNNPIEERYTSELVTVKPMVKPHETTRNT